MIFIYAVYIAAVVSVACLANTVHPVLAFAVFFVGLNYSNKKLAAMRAKRDARSTALVVR